ncbi:MAG: hypothetical protein IPO01_04680 [Chitinophagaceae bacterium]|nr:hypothetical protein [Chitinophagaceae bacterium]
MFSPKVLDRANVIEFSVTDKEMKSYLLSNSNINLDNLQAQGAIMSASFIEIAKDINTKAANTEELNNTLIRFFLN